MNNFSKLLKMELGQQIPVKSCCKLNKDMVKRAQSCLSDIPTNMDYSCWYSQKMGQLPTYNCCGLMEYSLPNSRLGFFNTCVTQKFYL